MHLYLLLSKFVFVYSQWYVGEEKQQTLTSIVTEDASKPVPAQSPIQCVLKCRRKQKKSFFVKAKNECFCVEEENRGFGTDQESSIEGMLYKEHMECFATSCKELKKICPDCESRIYTLDFDEPTKVFCDMETDGGGWLAIGKIVFDDVSLQSYLGNEVINKPGKISQLQNVQSGQFLLETTALSTLQQYIGFTEFRIKCFKPGHGRTLSVVLSGIQIMSYLLDPLNTVYTGHCGASRFLPDDSSVIGATNCQHTKTGYVGHTEIYSLPFYIAYHDVWLYHFRCDDYSGTLGTWEFYLR
eukprot:TCONS_00058171-protein